MKSTIFVWIVVIITVLIIISLSINPDEIEYNYFQHYEILKSNSSMNECFYLDENNEYISIRRHVNLNKLTNKLIIRQKCKDKLLNIKSKQFDFVLSLERKPRILRGPEDPRIFMFRNQKYIILQELGR